MSCMDGTALMRILDGNSVDVAVFIVNRCGQITWSKQEQIAK